MRKKETPLSLEVSAYGLTRASVLDGFHETTDRLPWTVSVELRVRRVFADRVSGDDCLTNNQWE